MASLDAVQRPATAPDRPERVSGTGAGRRRRPAEATLWQHGVVKRRPFP